MRRLLWLLVPLLLLLGASPLWPADGPTTAAPAPLRLAPRQGTPTPTEDPSTTPTASPAVTLTPAACLASAGGNGAGCDHAGFYGYGFNVTNACEDAFFGQVTVLFEVSDSYGGPWTIWDQRPTYVHLFQPGLNQIGGTLLEGLIPLPYTFFRFELSITYAGGPYYAATWPVQICNLYTITPTLPVPTVTPTPSSTRTPPPGPCAAWQIVASPNGDLVSNTLSAIAVVAANDVWAAGFSYDYTTTRTLVLHWDGASWAVVPSPNPGSDSALWGVAAVAPNDVWAVGVYSGRTLTLHWDGMSWTVVPSPNPGSSGGLWGVAAVAPNDVWAVGVYSGGTLTLHWDGVSWTVVPSPNVGGLRGVAAVAANDIWAVGGYSGRTLTLHWDGMSWTVVPSPDPISGDDTLRAVAVVATNDVWAVGDTNTGNGSQTLVLHWDGVSWAVVPSPNPGTRLNMLSGVAAVAANDIWATGFHFSWDTGLSYSTEVNQALALHWDGASWTVVPNPHTGTGNNFLEAVAAVATTDVWAVGSYCCSGPVGGTLTERYTPVQFADVPGTNPFYPYIQCLACRGIAGGYPCGGPGEPCPGAYFRPNNNVTRGQVSKIVSEAAGFSDPMPPTQQTFADVPLSGTFWLWVERLSTRGIVGGYPCGGPFEPCVAPTNRPYFRPNNNVTRGQLAKITSGAAGWTETPTGQTFEDVPPGSTFALYVERMASRSVIGGYPCGGAGEPCVAPANRPYFRPNNNATRGQMSKIAAAAFFPACQAPPGSGGIGR